METSSQREAHSLSPFQSTEKMSWEKGGKVVKNALFLRHGS